MILARTPNWKMKVRVDGRELTIAYEGPLSDPAQVRDEILRRVTISAWRKDNPRPKVSAVGEPYQRETDGREFGTEPLPPKMQPK